MQNIGTLWPVDVEHGWIIAGSELRERECGVLDGGYGGISLSVSAVAECDSVALHQSPVSRKDEDAIEVVQDIALMF